MKTELDILLENIGPGRNHDVISSRVDMALNSFPVKEALVTDFDEFRKITSEFYCHIENLVLRLDPQRRVHPDNDWGGCRSLFLKAFGHEGEKAAFELARTGNEFGFYRVLREIANGMIQEYAQNVISSRVHHYLAGLSVDEKFKAIDEYLLKYGHLLPSEITEGSAARIKMNFAKVLIEHPRMMRTLKAATDKGFNRS